MRVMGCEAVAYDSSPASTIDFLSALKHESIFSVGASLKIVYFFVNKSHIRWKKNYGA